MSSYLEVISSVMAVYAQRTNRTSTSRPTTSSETTHSIRTKHYRGKLCSISMGKGIQRSTGRNFKRSSRANIRKKLWPRGAGTFHTWLWRICFLIDGKMQNVNKVNTKATLRCPLNQPWIPKWAVHDLVKDVWHAPIIYSRAYWTHLLRI